MDTPGRSFLTPREWDTLVRAWRLSPRESDVIAELLKDGASDKSISTQLAMSESTVRTHFRHVFDRQRIGSRTELVIRAIKTIRGSRGSR